MAKKIIVGNAQVPLGVTEESYKMTNSKSKATAFKNYAARYQVSYLHKCLHKLSDVIFCACCTRLEESYGLLKYFPGTENKPLSGGDHIEILVITALAQ